MLNIPGLGPKTVKLIYERIPISLALNIADNFIVGLEKIKAVEKVEVGGSLRRRKETIRDIDILVVSKNPSEVMNEFVSLPQVKKVLVHGESKASIISGDDRQVDLRVVEKKNFCAALLYFTGSKDFNVGLRRLAARKGYKINEYGIFKGKKRVAGETEEEIFSFMNMEYIPPVLRENRGEIEAAIEGKLPNLIQVDDIKGDLHIHSKYSDGFASLEEIAAYAQKLGYEYIAVTDHSQSLKVARGLSEESLFEKIEEIKKINKKFKKLKIFAGAEVDILSDGTLDYPEKVLKKLDVVIAEELYED